MRIIVVLLFVWLAASVLLAPFVGQAARALRRRLDRPLDPCDHGARRYVDARTGSSTDAPDPAAAGA